MPIVTRSNGDVRGVTNVDSGKGPGVIVAPGLTKVPTVYKITFANSVQNETVTGGAVETVLRSIGTDSTIVLYQVENDSTGNVSVMLEATGAGNSASYAATTLQARIRAITEASGTGSNIGVASTVFANVVTVSGSYGFNLKA